VNDEESIKAITGAVDMGIDFFDTSDVYGTGHSEEILGKALEEKRNRVVLATKFGFTYDVSKREITGTDFSKDYIKWACEQSMKRLRTDYIDLYQLHLSEISHENIEEIIETLEDLKRMGYIRAYGWSTGDLSGAEKFIEKSNCSSIQHPENVLDYDEGMLKLCEKHDVASIANMPLAMGLLSGKYNSGSRMNSNEVRGVKHKWVKYFKDGKPDEIFLKKLESVKSVLTADGRSLVQGALGWLWTKSDKNIPIPGFKNMKQMKENAGALEFGPLKREQLVEIEKILESE
jgi:aryl-alcohol dehydrogenase-like predicted oxidoreductase